MRDNKMKKIIVFVGIILAIVVGADLLISAVSKDAILNVKDVGVNQTNTVQALFKRKADLLILGPSTANHHFDCQILKDSLGMTCYNAGRDGQNIIYNAMVLDAFLTRCMPKMVVVDVGGSSLSEEWMDRLNDFNCYYGILKPVDDILDSIGTPIDKIKRLSGIYRYNKSWEWLLNARIAKEVADLDGYRPMPVNADTQFSAVKQQGKFQINQKCLHYLNHIVQTCKKNKIRLILTKSPSLIINQGNFVPEVKAFSFKKGLEFMDWNGDTAYTNHPELFYDMTHLNQEGAKVFTREFLKRLTDTNHTDSHE